MDRISTSTKAVDLFGSGKHGFKDGNLALGISPTDFNAAFFNDLQEEPLSIIEIAGIAPAAGQRDQMAKAIQTGKLFSATAAGTADAITATFTPGVGMLVNGMALFVRAAAANATPTPTFTPASGTIAPKAIVKGANAALAAGDIAGAGHWLEFQYDATLDKWVLKNPATGVSTVVAATGFRNKIINGGMTVDQRNAGAAQTFTAAAALAYCVDRWYGYCTGANISGQKVALANGQNRYRFTGAAANTGFGFGQRIEAVNSLDLAGSTATLQAKIKSTSLASITWTAYYANTADAFGSLASPTRTQIATGAFNISAVEATYSTQIAIPAAATTGIEIVFTGGSLLAGQTCDIGDVQLESGSTATAFERRPITTELAACQRYFEKLGMTIQSSYANGGTGFANWWFKVSKRATPTIFLAGGSSGSQVADLDSMNVSAGGYAYLNAGTTVSAEL